MSLNQRISPNLSETSCKQQAQACKQGGFTLIELMIVIAILGILMAIGGTSWTSYRESTKADVAKGQIVNMLQQARLKALSSGEEQVVGFDYTADSATTATGQVFSFEGVDIQDILADCTLPASPTTSQNFTFKRRGTGTPTSLKVSSGNKFYVITVNGVTGRIKVKAQSECP